MKTTLDSLETTVTQMTGRTPQAIRRAPLPRLQGALPPGFVSSAQINRDLDEVITTSPRSDLADLLAILGFLLLVAALGAGMAWLNSSH
jgi:hypothetical protein